MPDSMDRRDVQRLGRFSISNRDDGLDKHEAPLPLLVPLR
jgi:hypothetical protein